MTEHRIHLAPHHFTARPHLLFEGDGLRAELFTYDSGVPAVRLAHARGEVVVLPYLGQMIWSACFDGVDLAMGSPFRMPRATRDLMDTYGCLLFHSGLLRNGNPGPQDRHAPHGEMPCAPMDRAWLSTGADEGGAWLTLHGEVEYLRGFGDHYLAQPSVTLRAGQTLFEVRMTVRNLSRAPMDLMYMAHANFAYVDGGRIVQPTGFGPADTAVRGSVPAQVSTEEAYLQRLAAMAQDPSSTEWLVRPERYDPELVFYLRQLRRDADGLSRFLLQRPAGDAFAVHFDPQAWGHAVRWILHSPQAQVCSFAMPSTCEVEGHAAERRKGHVRQLAGGAQADFSVTLGYLDQHAAQAEEARIRAT